MAPSDGDTSSKRSARACRRTAPAFASAASPEASYANSADFHQTTTPGGLIGEGTGVAAKTLKSMGVSLKDARIEPGIRSDVVQMHITHDGRIQSRDHGTIRIFL